MIANKGEEKLNTEINLAISNLFADPLLSKLPAGSWQVSPNFSDNVLSLAIKINYESLYSNSWWEISDPYLFLNKVGKEIAIAIAKYCIAISADPIVSFPIKFSVNGTDGREEKLSCTSTALLGALLADKFDTPWGIMTILNDDTSI